MQYDYSTWGLDEAHATTLLAQYDQGYTIPQPITEAVLDAVREMSLALAVSKRLEDAYRLDQLLHTALETAYAASPDASYLAQALLDKVVQAAYAMERQPTVFAPYTQLHALIAQFEGKVGLFVYLKHLAASHLLHLYEMWPLNGGLPDSLPLDQRQYLDELKQNFFVQLDASAQQQLADHKLWWKLMNLQADEYFHAALFNEAQRVRKRIVQTWEGAADVPAELRAEAYFSLGMLYTEFQKWQAALPHFQKAQALYAEAGPQHEPFMWQAEGWVEQCQQQLG